MLGFSTELPYTRIRVPPCKLLGDPSDAMLVTQSHEHFEHFNNHSAEFTDQLPCGRLCLGLSLSYIHSTLIDEETEAQRGEEIGEYESGQQTFSPHQCQLYRRESQA